MKTISMRAALRVWNDKEMYDRLQSYCRSMNISMSTLQLNGEVIVHFTAHPQQLMELEEHLEKVGV